MSKISLKKNYGRRGKIKKKVDTYKFFFLLSKFQVKFSMGQGEHLKLKDNFFLSHEVFDYLHGGADILLIFNL